MLLKSVLQFVQYWYFRYLMVTEMYMLESWERAVMHLILAVTFAGLWYFNYSIVLSGISQFRDWETTNKIS